MTTAVFNKVEYRLAQLLSDIELGSLSLPDIQRPFVWQPARVRDLFDSMYQGFPVGYLLFWKTLAGEGRGIGVDAKQKVADLLIVDGQQRLTSLYSVLKKKPVLRDDYSEHRIHIAFNPLKEIFAVTDAAIRKDPEYIPDIAELWTSGEGEHAFVERFLRELGEHREFTPEERKAIPHAISRLNELEQYPFTALELNASLDEEKVADVFVRINSQGVKLNQADFILTLMSVFWEKGRVELEDFCRSAKQPSTTGPSPFNRFIEPSPDQLLRVDVGVAFSRGRLKNVYNLLRGKDLETGLPSPEQRQVQLDLLATAQAKVVDLTNWHEFLKCVLAGGYSSKDVITSENALLYSYVLYLHGRHSFGVNHTTLRTTIARWFFMSSLTGRYTNSPETRIEEDLARLRPARSADDFLGVLEEQVVGALTNDYWELQLPNALSTSAARSPSLYAFYAAQRLLGTRVLYSSLTVAELLDPQVKAKKAALDRHHLFPRGYLKTLGIENLREVNQIANFTLVEWTDNIEISADPPSSYVPGYEAKVRNMGDDGEQQLATMYADHALPDTWHTMTYEEFLIERRKRMASVIKRGFAKIA